MLSLYDSVLKLKGVGKARAEALERIGIKTIGDLLSYYPRAYEDRTKLMSIAQACDGQAVCIEATLGTNVKTATIRKGFTISKCRITDGQSVADVVFFNRKFLENQLKVGEEYIFYGQVSLFNNRFQLENPQFEPRGRGKVTGKILPVYPLTQGITRGFLAGLVENALCQIDEIPDPVPSSVTVGAGLVSLDRAIRDIHFPPSPDGARQGANRLSFDELCAYCGALAQMKGEVKALNGPKMELFDLSELTSNLPFELTNAQKRVIKEIFSDMSGDSAMNRLVQGDVGSGKTMVAAAAVFLAAKNGYQSAVMAPTEILAAQHMKTLAPILKKCGIKCGMITGSTPKKERDGLLMALLAGEIQVIIGTHALLEDRVKFQRPGLFVIDEQHRFGVRQRASLQEKVEERHTLVMSATPIPRTLNLIIYGELDVSVLDEMPPGRKKIQTHVVDTSYDTRLYGFINAEIEAGGQVYVVCPLALENEESDLASAQEYAAFLREKVFSHHRVEMLHGKLKAREKADIMGRFTAGDTKILVSTTVIEVGVDVPNAALIVVRNAERFGLSQLHQLRGRVGRGSRKSYCILVSNSRSKDTQSRLKVMADTSDGFVIAQEDLKMRGPGDFFGQAQHGLPCYGQIVARADVDTVYLSQKTVEDIMQNDPELVLESNRWLEDKIEGLRKKMGVAALN